MQKSINSQIDIVDRILQFDLYTGKNLVDWFHPLVTCINSNGSIPYLLDKRNYRFRASPLASTIIWMDKANLLPENAISLMQTRLLYLRDNNEDNDEHPGREQKYDEDTDGWSVGEGVSIWSTSMAILALIDRKQLGLNQATEFKKSIIWLAKQKKVGDNGWGYQCSSNCQENIIMTALATRAIALSLKFKDKLGFSSDEENILNNAVIYGFTYIKDNMKKKNAEIFWCFNNKKSCAATVWSLLALKELENISLKEEIKTFYSKIIKAGRQGIINSIPSKICRWEDELIVNEAGAKYGSMKNYYSFSPTLLMDIFDLGVSPFNSRIVNQIRWLLQNTEDWKIKEYDSQSICTFTYSMVLSTIVKWVSLVGKESAEKLINAPCNTTNKVSEYLLGYSLFKDSPMQIIDKSRLLFVWIFSLLLLFALFNRDMIIGRIYPVINQFILKGYTHINTIIINVISNATYALIIFLIGIIVKKFIQRLGQ